MTKTEIYIAVGDEKTHLPEQDWQKFCEEVVTPRFPVGYSILSGQGHWLNSTLGRDQRLDNRVVVILHKGDAATSAKIDEIRTIWKERYPCESVLRVDSQVHLSL